MIGYSVRVRESLALAGLSAVGRKQPRDRLFGHQSPDRCDDTCGGLFVLCRLFRMFRTVVVSVWRMLVSWILIWFGFNSVSFHRMGHGTCDG